MDVFEAIKGGRSIRSFENKEVTDETVETVLEAALWAPSAGNIQPWKFVVVRDAGLKKRLAEAALDQSFIESAPIVIVVCADEARSSEGYGQRGKTLYCIQDTAAAIQNIHLAAYALGLGTCWVGAFNEDLVVGILNVPCGLRPICLIPVGYASKLPPPRPRRSLDEIAISEFFERESQ